MYLELTTLLIFEYLGFLEGEFSRQWGCGCTHFTAFTKTPALLGVIVDENKSYVLRELQPVQDQVSLQAWDGKLGRLEKLMQTMGEVTACDQLRSDGRHWSLD